MIISSEKANIRAAKAVKFAARHRWAKLFCVGAVAAVYSADYIRQSAVQIGEKIRDSAQAPFRPLGGRIVSLIMSGAFAFMTVPFAAASASAEETEETQSSAAEEHPDPTKKLPEHPRVAATPAAIADKITLSGLAEDNLSYGLTLNVRTLKKDVTAMFRTSEDMSEQVKSAFDGYGIPTYNLCISPVDITLFTTEQKQKLQLSDGYSADITLPIPREMEGHFDDLKIVRLEDDGSMTVIEGDISSGAAGNTISFNTSHFSVFALVSYSDEPEANAENIGSGAGAQAGGVHTDISVSFGGNVFEEDKRRFGRDKKKRKIYRIKRIIRENELLL